MRREADARLWAVLEAIETIERYVAGRSVGEYVADELLRDGVERRLINIGEALNGFSREDPVRAARVSNLPAIVSLRNVLVHGYDRVRNEDVWRVVREDLPKLRATVTALLGRM